MDFQAAIVFDETQLPELIHEKIDPGAGGPHHFRQRLLADLGNHTLGRSFFPETGEQEKNPSQSFLAGIEKLIHQVLFVADVSRQQIPYEQIRKRVSPGGDEVAGIDWVSGSTPPTLCAATRLARWLASVERTWRRS